MLKAHKHPATFIALAPIFVLMGLLLSATYAWAVAAPIHIANTEGEGVFIRPEPNTSQPAVGWIPEGASPDYNCFAWGQDINGVPIWFNVNYNGRTGYYASYYDDSSYHSNEELTAKYGVPLCGSQAPAPAPVTAPSPSPSRTPNANYNRSAAVSWALAHAKDPQAFGTMCTWFVSRALWAGGLAQSSTWNAKGPYQYKDHLGLSTTVPGTEAAWLLSSFRKYFEPQFGVQKLDITRNLTTNAVPQAEIGDLIAYDWGEGDGISHVSIIVDIARGQYPEVAEMGQYDFGVVNGIVNKVKHISSSYSKRGWTWSQLSGKWLQQKHPHMHAYLLHIPGGHT